MVTKIAYKIGVLLVGSGLLASCMAPHCPIRSCHVQKEHQHGGRIYRGTFLGTTHGPQWWLANRKGEGAKASMASDRKGDGGDKQKTKFKKRFRWERG